MLTPEIYTELSKYRQNPVRNPDGADAMTLYLLKQGFIQQIDVTVIGLSIRPVEWEITVQGLVALSEFEEERRQQTQNKRKDRNDRLFQFALVLLGSLLTLLVEHFSDILAWLYSHLHSFG